MLWIVCFNGTGEHAHLAAVIRAGQRHDGAWKAAWAHWCDAAADAQPCDNRGVDGANEPQPLVERDPLKRPLSFVRDFVAATRCGFEGAHWLPDPTCC